MYRFAPELEADAEQEYCFHTIGSRFDSVLYARRSACGDRAAEQQCNDDNRGVTGEAGASALTIRVSAGDVFYVFVDGWSDLERGDYSLNLFVGSCEAGPQ